MIGGAACYYFYFDVDASNFNEVLQCIFMGVILTATSVSITVEALREMGKLNGPVGSAILGAAVLDDIIGIIILTVVTSLKDSSVSIISILIKIGLYVILMGVPVSYTHLHIFNSCRRSHQLENRSGNQSA